MADSISLASLEPYAGLFGLLAGYDDGHWPDAASIAATYPDKIVVRVTVDPRDDVGDVLDVERGDASPADAPGWVVGRRRAGSDPSVYMDASTWPAVIAAFDDAGVIAPSYWVASVPGGGPVIPPGAVAHQYWNGDNIDVSVVADYWPGIDAVQLPPNEEDDMPLYATNSAGTGFVVAADLSHKQGLPDATDAQVLLATGLYHQVALDDELLNLIPG